MPGAAAVIEQLAATRAQLDAAGDLLRSPTAGAVDHCTNLLESAAGRLSGLRAELAAAQGDAQAVEEAWRVRRSLQRAGKLLENAARFHQGWTAIRGALTGGYTDRGEPAPVRHPGRVFLEA